MSDREKLIDVVWKIDTMRAVGVELSECVDHLISNGVTVQKWIPVSEKLPTNGDVVLCCMCFDEMKMMQWDGRTGWWVGLMGDYKVDAVTHWMPLPEPPKECE